MLLSRNLWKLMIKTCLSITELNKYLFGTYSFLYVGDKSYKSIGNRLMQFVEFNQSNEYDIREY